jgi:uncharacterized hydrophobic protein (TIGR00271 family)
MSFFAAIEGKLGITPESRVSVYSRVSEASGPTLMYWLELLFSAGIATLGLVLNSPAVVIGAMLISPLMGPIIAAGLSLAAGDLYLGLKSALTLLASIAVAISFSAALVWLLPFHSPTAEILARTQPNLLDLGVALFSGLAGSLLVCRAGSESGVSALPGVAIAVALMPPLCTVGFGLGSGVLVPVMRGAGLLFMTNLAAIVASAFLVFLIVRMDPIHLRTRIDFGILERAADDRLYNALKNTRIARAFGDVGQWHWRALMLAVVLCMLFFPLRSGLMQVRDEVVSRTAVRDVVGRLVPKDAIVSQALDITPDSVVIRLILTTAIDAARVKTAERELVRRTSKNATIAVRKVVDDADLAVLRERIGTMSLPAEVPSSLDALKKEYVSRIDGPLRESWPSEAATLTGFQVILTNDKTVVQSSYTADRPLAPEVATVLTAVLRRTLNTNDVEIELRRDEPEPPAPPARAKKRAR